jgi:hypothetical protein
MSPKPVQPQEILKTADPSEDSRDALFLDDDSANLEAPVPSNPPEVLCSMIEPRIFNLSVMPDVSRQMVESMDVDQETRDEKKCNKSLDFEGVAEDVGKTPKKMDSVGKSSGVRKSIEKRGQEICGVIEISSDKSVWLLKSPGIQKSSENSENSRILSRCGLLNNC